MPVPDPSPEETIAAALAAIGLSASAEQIAALVRPHAISRQALALLATRHAADTDPATVFQAGEDDASRR